MAATVLIMGEPGTGKSTSIRNLNASETFIINILDKPLPFKGYRKNYSNFTIETPNGNYKAADETETILKVIQYVDTKRPDIATLIIDDFQYVMANDFMRRAKEKGYEKFTDIGQKAWSIINRCTSSRPSLDVFILSHTEIDDSGKVKMKTIGKMLNDKIAIEGMFTTVLHSLIVDKRYKFLTQHDGTHIAKSPIDMFDSSYIDNDLQYVKQQMNEFFGDIEMDISEAKIETKAQQEQ